MINYDRTLVPLHLIKVLVPDWIKNASHFNSALELWLLYFEDFLFADRSKYSDISLNRVWEGNRKCPKKLSKRGNVHCTLKPSFLASFGLFLEHLLGYLNAENSAETK